MVYQGKDLPAVTVALSSSVCKVTLVIAMVYSYGLFNSSLISSILANQCSVSNFSEDRRQGTAVSSEREESVQGSFIAALDGENVTQVQENVQKVTYNASITLYSSCYPPSFAKMSARLNNDNTFSFVSFSFALLLSGY